VQWRRSAGASILDSTSPDDEKTANDYVTRTLGIDFGGGGKMVNAPLAKNRHRISVGLIPLVCCGIYFNNELKIIIKIKIIIISIEKL
jgi:hypothetical protein